MFKRRKNRRRNSDSSSEFTYHDVTEGRGHQPSPELPRTATHSNEAQSRTRASYEHKELSMQTPSGHAYNASASSKESYVSEPYSSLDRRVRRNSPRRTPSSNSADYFAALNPRLSTGSDISSGSTDRRRHFHYDSTPELGSMDGHQYMRSQPEYAGYNSRNRNSKRQNFGYIAAFKKVRCGY